MKEREKFFFSLIIVSFLAIIAVILSSVFTDPSIKSGEKSQKASFLIYPRGQNGDSWTLNLLDKPIQTGTIYLAKVSNLSRKNMTNWKIVFKAKKNCYINYAWTGDLEIFQHRGVKTIHQQAINFKDLNPANLVSEKIAIPGKPLLVPLNKGDRMVYHPTTGTYSENFLASTSSTGDISSSTVGFIFYKESKYDDLDFISARLVYHFDLNLLDKPMFYVGFMLLLMWIILVLFVIKLRAASELQKKKKAHDRNTIEQVMAVFTKFIDAKDIYTGGHSERVANISRLIAKEMGKSEEFCENIFFCGLLHDCGKIAINDSILKKDGNLSETEFQILQEHTTKGYDLLKNLSSIPEARETALHHHERYDGTGYPDHLCGNFIPETARIVAVADAFDSMNTGKKFKSRLTVDSIISELKTNMGTQFEPAVVKAILSLIYKGDITFI